MRPVVPITIAFLAIACGPDPNAHLPGSQYQSGSGGIFEGSGGAGNGGIGVGGGSVPSGGSAGRGGAPGSGGIGIGAGGSKPGSGGASGSTGSGGAGGSNPFDTGGAAGGASGGSGGSTVIGSGGVGSGGTTSTSSKGGSSGTASGYTFPVGTEPCTPMKDISGGQSDRFGTTGPFCFRTADDFTDYGCSGADGRTVKINGTEITTCGGKPPAKLGSFYYFDFGPGKYDYTSVNWYCSTGNCPPLHPVPSCGHYPPWQSGATAVPPCVDAPPSTPSDAAAPVSSIDSGS